MELTEKGGIRIYEGLSKARALFDFTAENEGELTFKKGDIITILDEDADNQWDGWWEGLLESGDVGFFPAEGWVVKLSREEAGTMPDRIILEDIKEEDKHAQIDLKKKRMSTDLSSLPTDKKKKKKKDSKKKKKTEKTESTNDKEEVSSPKKKTRSTKDKHDDSKTISPRAEKPVANNELVDTSYERRKRRKTLAEIVKVKVKRLSQKRKPTRKAPKSKKNDIEIGAPTGFQKMGGYSNNTMSKAEDQLAATYIKEWREDKDSKKELGKKVKEKKEKKKKKDKGNPL
eukprot:TRINITY_DN21815_c0_g1_i1.p1 TRINITY_DN21815_c0_g1~~TRINITY_DN21815_c0_g1_i1.p1  ORF type:complete len:287 (-),score=91.26 TRINITY_DN21815_c0_g1_i1:237-1097(-)